MFHINFIILTWLLADMKEYVANEKEASAPESEHQNKKIDFAVGGQAVIEGVMMRSPNTLVISVRKPDNEIKVKKRNYQTLTQRFKILNLPILRGVVNLFEMMVIGTQAINFSAQESLDEEAPDTKKSEKKEKNTENRTNSKENSKENEKSHAKKEGSVLETLMFVFSIVIGLGLSIFLFKFIPLWLTTFIEGNSSLITNSYIAFNLLDGVFKILIFLSYIAILSAIPSFRRIFEYHGAEHKSIFAYESGKDLTVSNAKTQSRFHPRCGTSFILIVFLISILVYTFVPKQEVFLTNLLVRLAFLPLIAGISYEYLKLSAKYSKNSLVRALIAPGLWFQKMTTKNPNDSQLEVGLSSLTEALALEKANLR